MWFVYAIGASVMWGLTYVINEQLFKKISVISALAIISFVSSVVISIWAFMGGYLKRDFLSITQSPRLLWLLIASVLIFILAEILINFSIADKNTTLASLIEISYPIFVAIFSYLIYRQRQLNLGTAIGGVMIFAGVAVVYLFNK
ncbi:MAG: DMT family transporter [bacterium]|nr:DMT family transporter [bacterium]